MLTFNKELMKIWYSVLMVSVLFLSSSCQKWLEVPPEKQQLTEDCWANKEEAAAALGPAYVGIEKAVPDTLTFGEGRGNTLSSAGLVDADLVRLKGLST